MYAYHVEICRRKHALIFFKHTLTQDHLIKCKNEYNYNTDIYALVP